MTTIYLLTIDGKPAGQDRDGWTFFPNSNCNAKATTSLKAVRSLIGKAEEWDRKHPSVDRPFRYDYKRVKVCE